MKLKKFDPNQIRVSKRDIMSQSDEMPNWEPDGAYSEAWESFRKLLLDEHQMDVTGIATDATWAVDDFYRLVSEFQRQEAMRKWRNRR